MANVSDESVSVGRARFAWEIRFMQVEADELKQLGFTRLSSNSLLELDEVEAFFLALQV